MVRLLKLQTLNFKKTNIDPPLQLPNGVTLVSGPNESGKSTILDAILYGLYARVIRPKAIPSAEQLIAYGKSHAIVRLDFSIEEKIYRVERQIYLNKTGTANLWEVLQEDQLRVLATGQKQVSDQIEKLLAGISYNEILASTVVAQKDLEHLVKQGSGDRKKVINAFMNLESFNTVLDSQNEARRDLEGTSARPGRMTGEKRNLEEMQGRIEQYNKGAKEIGELERDTKTLEKEVANLTESQEKVEALFEALNKYKDAVDKKERINTKIKDGDKLAEHFRDQLGNLSKDETQFEDVKCELKKYADLDDIEERLARLGNLTQEMSLVSDRLNTGKRTQQEASRSVAELRRKLPRNADEKKIASAQPNTKIVWLMLALAIALFSAAFVLLAAGTPILFSLLPMLFGAISVLFAARQMFAESKLRVILSDLGTLRQKRSELENLTKRVSQLEKEERGYEKQILIMSEGITRYAAVFSKTKSKGPVAVARAMSMALGKDKGTKRELDGRMATLGTRVKEKPSIERNLRNSEDDLEKLKSALSVIEFPDLPRGVRFSTELLDKTSKERSKTYGDLREKEKELQMVRDSASKLRQFMKENQDLPEKLKKQAELVASLEHEFNVAKVAITGLERTSEALRSRVKPYVEQYMELILPTITNERYKAAELDEDYNLKVWDPDAGEFKSREVFSGGTEDQFLLSMRLAFAVALLPEIKGMHPEFLFLDEPLGSSDELRRQGIVDLLSAELSSKFKQIFLISHIGNLEAEVDNLIRMEDGQVVEVITK